MCARRLYFLANAELRWVQVRQRKDEKYETITLGESETVGHAWDFYFGQKTVTFLETTWF